MLELANFNLQIKSEAEFMFQFDMSTKTVSKKTQYFAKKTKGFAQYVND